MRKALILIRVAAGLTVLMLIMLGASQGTQAQAPGTIYPGQGSANARVGAPPGADCRPPRVFCEGNPIWRIRFLSPDYCLMGTGLCRGSDASEIQRFYGRPRISAPDFLSYRDQGLDFLIDRENRISEIHIYRPSR